MSTTETQNDQVQRRGKPKKVSASRAQELKKKSEIVPRSTAVNASLWVLTIGLVIGVSVFNTMYAAQFATYYRLVIVVAAIAGALGSFSLTNQGRRFIKFGMESLLELKKIYWPTRKEALQTAIIVVIVCIITSFSFWFVDSVINTVVNYVINFRF